MEDKGEYDKAIADCTEAIRTDPQSASAFYDRGRAWDEKGEYDKAIADFTEAICLDAQNAHRYDNLVWLLAACPDDNCRDGDKAVQLAEQACELTDYADAICLNALAVAHAEKGNFDDAVAWQLKALDLAAENDKADMRVCLELYEAGNPYRWE